MSEREEYSGDLSAYLDGELSESRRQRLDEVLQYDKELARELDRLRATRDLIRTLPTAQPPRDFATRVVARGERMRLLGTLRRPRSYQWINLAAAAVVLVAAGLSLVIMLKMPPKQPPVDTFEKEGMVAFDATNGTRSGDEVEENGKRFDEVVAKTGTPERPAKETPLAKIGKGGPGRGELAEEMTANGRASKAGAGRGTHMKPKGSLERTLDAARRAARKVSKDGVDEGDFVIYTDNLAFAQRDVENVLAYNGIQPVRSTTTADAVPGKPIHSRMNFFNTTQTTVSQVQYEVFVPPQQAVKLKNELNVIREQQKVSQAAMPPGTDLAALAPKLATATPRKVDDGYKTKQLAGKMAAGAADEGKSIPKPAKPGPTDRMGTDAGQKAAAGLPTQEERVKTEDKPVTRAKVKPAPKPPREKAMPPEPGPTAKPGEAGAQVAIEGQERAPAPAVTAPASGMIAAQKAKRGTAEGEAGLGQRPDFERRPGDGEQVAAQKKHRTGPRTLPAKPVVTSTAPTQAILAMTQEALKIESQAGANVMRLLITLNHRDARASRAAVKALKAAEELKKAAKQKAEPAAKDAANQAH